MSLGQTLRRLFGRRPRPRGRRDVPLHERRSAEVTVQLRTPPPPVVERRLDVLPVPPLSPRGAPPPVQNWNAQAASPLRPPQPARDDVTRRAPVAAVQTGLVGVLIATEGELCGEVYGVPGGECRLGRSPECEIKIASEWVSREHARIVHRSGVFAIAPLARDNPTLVNGQFTEGAELHDGDVVHVGRTTLRFRTLEG